MCERQPGATRQRAMCKRVDILYVTYLTRTAREAAVKETDTDKQRWCTLTKPEHHPAGLEAVLHRLEACAKKANTCKAQRV